MERTKLRGDIERLEKEREPSPEKTVRTTVPYLSGTASADIRPLSVDEIQQLMLLARKTGWYGNMKLIDFIVRAGLSHEESDIKIAKHDVYFEYNIARRIWILTLRSLRQRVRLLLPFSKVIKKIERISGYDFTDLATPGLLFLIKKDMLRVDAKGYAKAILKHSVMNIKHEGRLMTKTEKDAFLDKNMDDILEWFIDIHKMEKRSFKRLPNSLFSTPEEKFYIIEKLASTLDWIQFYKILFAYNTILTELIHKSNQLGGLDCGLRDAKLITGTPIIFNLIRPLKSIPFEVCIALMQATIRNNLNDFTPREKKRLTESFDRAKKETANTCRQEKIEDKRKKVLELNNRFAIGINKDKKLISKACFTYWEEFISYFNRETREHAEKHEEQDRVLTVPDCYVLVEGPSDEIIFSHFLTLFQEYEVFVELQDCNGKQGVKRRFQDLIEKEAYIGSIVTILDSDGHKEHEDLKRMSKGNEFVRHFIYTRGTVEDLFSTRLHVKIINRLYSSGDTVRYSDLRSSAPIERIIKKVIWNKKRAAFDKKIYAKAITRELRKKTSIPTHAKEIVASILDLAKLRAKKMPRLYSHLTIDRLSRDEQWKRNLHK